MNRLLYITIGVLLGVLLVSLYFNNRQKKEKEALSIALSKCINSPVKVDTVYDTIRILDVKYIKPKPIKPDDNKWIPEPSTEGCKNISPTFYSEHLQEQGVEIHWEALSACENDSAKIQFIRFPYISIPKQTIVETVEVEKRVEVEAKLKGKFLATGGVVFNSFDKFPGVEAGIGYLYKQNWGVQLSGIYLQNTGYVSTKVFVTF